MKKKIVWMIILITAYPLYSSPYNNIFWANDFFRILYLKDRIYTPDKSEITYSFSFDAARGINYGFYYEIKAVQFFSKALNVSTAIKLNNNDLKLKTIIEGITFQPLSFLKFSIDYRYRNFIQYRIGEHNLFFRSYLILNPIKYFYFSTLFGVNLRFVDLLLGDQGTVYKQDWLFEALFLCELELMIYPVYFFSCGFKIGNLDEYEIYSVNYLQFDFFIYFHLPRHFSIYSDGGFAYSGSLPGAGMINRFWLKIGFLYEIKIL